MQLLASKIALNIVKNSCRPDESKHTIRFFLSGHTESLSDATFGK